MVAIAPTTQVTMVLGTTSSRFIEGDSSDEDLA
jgi:hypothetical protein